MKNWKRIEKLLESVAPKREHVAGCTAYNSLSMFKAYLLLSWYNLSEVQLSEQLNYNLLFMKFCNFTMSSDIPDHSTISRFKNKLINNGLLDRIFIE